VRLQVLAGGGVDHRGGAGVEEEVLGRWHQASCVVRAAGVFLLALAFRRPKRRAPPWSVRRQPARWQMAMAPTDMEQAVVGCRQQHASGTRSSRVDRVVPYLLARSNRRKIS
jgi:hypothetical protein